MKNESVGTMLAFILFFWAAGIALSKGFWLVLLSVVFPPYAWVVSAGWIIEIIDRITK